MRHQQKHQTPPTNKNQNDQQHQPTKTKNAQQHQPARTKMANIIQKNVYALKIRMSTTTFILLVKRLFTQA